ncbi:alpha/beta hydrolase [Candidatus Bathyarchaeota archaeon]|nr:alpha/beta hydrolase [Candidatus Bathyarchaeota archaeon]
MEKIKENHYLVLILLLLLFLNTVCFAEKLDTDNESIIVKEIKIQSNNYQISGRLYIPKIVYNTDTKVPGILILHGISCTKEMLSGLALETTKAGFISLTIDLAGHGESGGILGGEDPTLGAEAAFNYLAQMNNVDQTKIGVVGHSLGAGAIRTLALNNINITSTIFIGGGVGGSNNVSNSNTLSATLPKNLLIIVGEHDVLFNIDSLEPTLRHIFNTNEKIISEQVYGDFSSGNARKLLILSTIHLLEPLDLYSVHNIVDWFNSSFYSDINNIQIKGFTYIIREITLIFALTTLILTIIPISQIFNEKILYTKNEEIIIKHRFLSEKEVLFAWGFLGVILFIPTMLVGALIPFPTLLIGSSMAWWLLSTGLIGLVILYLLNQRRLKEYKDLQKVIRLSFKYKDVYLALFLIVCLYLLSSFSQLFLLQKVRIFVPILPVLTTTRLIILPQFLLFYIIYFLSEGLYLHVYRARLPYNSKIIDFLMTLILKISPYIILLCIQYIPMYFFGIRLIPSFAAFFVEFLFAIIPMLIISTFSSWWLNNYTRRIGAGVIFNTLLYSWITAGLFPFGGFF